MTTPVHNILGVRNLNGLVRAFESEVGNRVFSSLFMDRGRRLEPEESDVVEWDERQAPRHLAPVSTRHSPYQRVTPVTILNRRSAMTHIRVSRVIGADRLYLQRAPGQLRAGAGQVVADNVRDLMKVIGNSIEYMCINTLNGTLTVNSTNIPGSLVTFTLTYTPNTYTANTSWAAAGTRIVSDELHRLKQDFSQASGKEPFECITGGTVAGYLEQNTEILNLLSPQFGREVAAGGAPLVGRILSGFSLGGLQWTMTEGGYVPEGGAFTRYIPATDDLYVLPQDLSDVLGMALGQGFLPSASGIASAEQAASLVTPAPQRGFYSFAARAKDVPDAVEIFVGWVGLPILMYPTGICVADVVP